MARALAKRGHLKVHLFCRVGKQKASFNIAVHKIYLEAQQVHEVLFFNKNLKLKGLKNIVSRFNLIKTNDIAHPGTATAPYPNAQSIIFRNVFGV